MTARASCPAATASPRSSSRRRSSPTSRGARRSGGEKNGVRHHFSGVGNLTRLFVPSEKWCLTPFFSSDPPFEPELLDLARQRVPAPAEQLRGLEPLAARAPQRGDDQRPLECGQRLGQQRLRRPCRELAFGPLRK